MYIGDWRHGIKEGKGKWSSPEGDFYIGEWVDSKAHGWGKHV